jgi:hypothetical protein
MLPSRGYQVNTLRNIALRCVLVSVLVFSGVAKLVSGYDVTYVTGETVYWLTTACELVAAVLLLTRWRIGCMIATGLVMAIAAGGILITYVDHGQRGCGCFGEMLRLSTRQHRIVAGTIGLMAALVFGEMHGKWRVDTGARSAVSGGSGA